MNAIPVYVFDGLAFSCGADFWRAYLSVVRPEAGAGFGCNLDAFRDALLGGGPGWPGERELCWINTENLRSWRQGRFLAGLQALASDSRAIRLILE